MYATQEGEHIPELERLLEDADYTGRDLEIRHPQRSKTRGPIKKIWVSKDKLLVELDWAANKRNGKTPWVSAPDRLKRHEYDVAWWCPEDVAGQLVLNAAGTALILHPSDCLSRSEVTTEYHVEVHVRHSLYPPFPFEDELQNVGLVQNVDPPYPQTQSEVKVAAITFVVFAFSRRAAEAWCRAECGRFRLPVISMRLGEVLPGS